MLQTEVAVCLHHFHTPPEHHRAARDLVSARVDIHMEQQQTPDKKIAPSFEFSCRRSSVGVAQGLFQAARSHVVTTNTIHFTVNYRITRSVCKRTNGRALARICLTPATHRLHAFVDPCTGGQNGSKAREDRVQGDTSSARGFQGRRACSRAHAAAETCESLSAAFRWGLRSMSKRPDGRA